MVFKVLAPMFYKWDWSKAMLFKLRHVDILYDNHLGTADGHIPKIQPKFTGYYLLMLASGMSTFKLYNMDTTNIHKGKETPDVCMAYPLASPPPLTSHLKNYSETNVRHHVISSENISLHISKRWGYFEKFNSHGTIIPKTINSLIYSGIIQTILF